MTKKIYYTNNDLDRGVRSIAIKMFRSPWRPDFIIGILRGGVIPAVYLSHWVDVPMMAIEWSNRDNAVGQNIDDSEIIKRVSQGQKVLVVDDICDTGVTFRKVATELTSIWHYNHTKGLNHVDMKTACLHYNIGQSTFEPDYYHLEIDKTEDPCWIVYPWEDV